MANHDLPKVLFAVFYIDVRDGKKHFFSKLAPVAENRRLLEKQVADFQRQTFELTGKKIELFIHTYGLVD